jgi:hypothetical protein
MATEWPTMPLPPATRATRRVPLFVTSSLPVTTWNPFAHSKRAQAAVDDEIGAGNVTALVGSQEQRRGSNFLGPTKAVEQSPCNLGINLFLSDSGIAVPMDTSGLRASGHRLPDRCAACNIVRSCHPGSSPVGIWLIPDRNGKGGSGSIGESRASGLLRG